MLSGSQPQLGGLAARGGVDDLMVGTSARSSKVEITEMVLGELALAEPDALEQRLARFRRRAPRERPLTPYGQAPRVGMDVAALSPDPRPSRFAIA